ncbi:FHAD1-like protein [Mya arenaria]|uniref:FHAD1-like protein n=1 Tax=Mya arenaria TaxID=6604 RepID=A0ABY7EY75_MYAAR|nr:FHAD1-like protein [Mya arenaria]
MSRNTKAFLKSGDGAYYQLAPKVTTIGKENCDILLQTNGVDQQHAIIEYSEQEDCYVLQDLNSGQGTYVNDVRVQNAAVRLAPGDVIRFGYCGQPYELNIDNPPPIAYPPVQHRPAWTGSLALLTDDRNMCNTQANQNPGLPYLTTPTLTVPATHWTPVAQAGPQIPQPRPPLRSRPLSAGAQRRPASAYDRLQTIGCTMQSATTNVASPLPRSGGWMNGGTGRSVEHKIRELSEEVSRLRNVEMDVSRKDQMLQQMQQQLQMAECQAQQQAMVVGSDPDVTNKLLQFEAEVSNKKQEILDLREQLSQLQAQAVIDLENPANIRAELSEKIKELNNMRNELERVKKDKNITSGLLSQKAFFVPLDTPPYNHKCHKDSSISKLTREIEALKKELREKDSQLKVMTSSVNKLKEPKTEERDARERELISLRQSSLDEAKSQAQDLERAERLVRVDLEQVSKKNERFRNRVVQTTFSTPGIKAPDTEISDDDLLETLKKIIDERTNSFRTIKELEQNSLKEEIGLLQSVSVDDHLAWVKEVTVGLLQGELSWETDIENALEKCGVNLKLTNDEPSKHINLLFAKWESAISDKERLVKQMSEIEVRHKEELELQISQQKTDLDGQVSDAVEKAKLEDDIRAVEQEKLDSALQAERRKIEELETTIEQLRYNLSEKNEDQQQKLEAGQEALSLVEEYQTIEAQLKEQVSKLEVDRNEQVTELTTELVEKEHKFESDLQGYKEQIKQHSVTICAMEERISKVMKKNKESQEEMETYRKQVQELKLQLTKKEREKPPPPPKPKVIPVVQKPKENAEVKTRMQEQDDVILGELSEGQKQEVEKLKEVVSHKEREVVEMRQQLAKFQAEQECKKIQSLKKSLDIEKNEQAKQLELMDQEGRITSELTALGAQCRGERHEQVIARQREALAELRSRVKTLEVARPPVPTQDQALQQVIMLKKELAEMRVNQALSEDKNIVSLTSLDREVGRARGLVSTTNADAEMERSAHRETMEALEASENSGIEGLRPLGHIPKDERERLLRERERSCDKLVNQVRVYRERISRKDELLQGYERDLAKLRQAQELAERKSVQLDTLATFHLENEKVHLAPASHRCKPEDPRAVLKKKRERDVLKRKNYEIKTLKTELTDKERNLFDAQNRLYTLSHSQDVEETEIVVED